MKRESTRFSQQAINRIAEIAIASQLKQEVEICVNITTTLNQLTKGQIDAIAILIRELVLSETLKTEVFQLDIGQVTVKPLSAMKGKIKLLHPSEGKLSVVMREADLTAALNQSMRSAQTLIPASVRCSIANQMLTLRFHPIDLSAPGKAAVESIALSPSPAAGQGILWQPLPAFDQSNQSEQSNQINPAWLADVLPHLDRLLSLKDFEQKGLFLSLQAIEMSEGKLRLDADALIQEFPPD